MFVFSPHMQDCGDMKHVVCTSIRVYRCNKHTSNVAVCFDCIWCTVVMFCPLLPPSGPDFRGNPCYELTSVPTTKVLWVVTDTNGGGATPCSGCSEEEQVVVMTRMQESWRSSLDNHKTWHFWVKTVTFFDYIAAKKRVTDVVSDCKFEQSSWSDSLLNVSNRYFRRC